MKNKDINIDDLVDIRTVKVDQTLSYEERLVEYVRQIKNPYLFKCGKYVIRAKYRKDGRSFQDSLRIIMDI